jgi:2'-5' RNA ligase
MALALVLTLDEDADAAVRRIWAGLDKAGVPSLATLLGGRLDPHVTLAISGDGEAMRALGPDLAELVRMSGPQVLPLGAVGLFPGADPPLYLAVTPTERLLRLHAEVDDLLRERRIETAALYRPGTWVPHCTVAMSVPEERCADALGVVRASPLPIQARGAQPGLIDTETGETAWL